MYHPDFKNQNKEMNIEIIKEIIFSFCQSEDFFFPQGNEKGGDKKWVVGVMTQKLGISWGLEGGKCVGVGVLGTTRDIISKPCQKRERRIYFHPTLDLPFPPMLPSAGRKTLCAIWKLSRPETSIPFLLPPLRILSLIPLFYQPAQLSFWRGLKILSVVILPLWYQSLIFPVALQLESFISIITFLSRIMIVIS